MKRKAVWIGCILAALFFGCAANARVIITLDQVGPNVVATGSGTLDLTDLTFFGRAGGTAVFIDPTGPFLVVGSPISVADIDLYAGISGPTTFGTGDFFTVASTGTGNALGIVSESALAVPHGYVSGMELSGTATWDNTTIDALGATPGIYTWNWGTSETGAHADSLTLKIAVVPEPAPALLLTLGAAGLALLKWRFF